MLIVDNRAKPLLAIQLANAKLLGAKSGVIQIREAAEHTDGKNIHILTLNAEMMFSQYTVSK